MNGSRWSRPGQVVVWPHCDPTKLANRLASTVYGVGADAEFVEVMNDLEAAKEWVRRRYTPYPESAERFRRIQANASQLIPFFIKGADPDISIRKGDYFLITRNGEWRGWRTHAVYHLFKKLGPSLLEGLYEAEMAKFKKLL